MGVEKMFAILICQDKAKDWTERKLVTTGDAIMKAFRMGNVCNVKGIGSLHYCGEVKFENEMEEAILSAEKAKEKEKAKETENSPAPSAAAASSSASGATSSAAQGPPAHGRAMATVFDSPDIAAEFVPVVHRTSPRTLTWT